MRYKIFIISLAAMSIVACTKAELRETPGQDNASVPEQEAEDVIKSAIIKVNDALVDILESSTASDKIYTKSQGFNSVIDDLSIVSYERLYPDAGEFETRTREDGLHKWYIVRYDSSRALVKADDAFAAVDGIEKVCKPRKISRRSLPNDPYFKWQWDLYNDLSLNLTIKYQGRTLSSNKGCSINVMDVWDNYTTGSNDVIVAVVDGGADFSHPDLAPNLVPAGAGGSYDFVNNSTNIVADAHGTHVAGTIAAARNNGIGVAGIAGGDYAAGIPGVKILSCQVFIGNSCASDAGFMRAIKWGADHGAVICQNSWGHTYDTDDSGDITALGLEQAKNDNIDDYEKDGVDYFIRRAGCDNYGNQLPTSPMKGGVVIFAAGNDSIEYGWPANYAPIIAVGASGPDWNPAWYSNYGDWVDIAAPGGDLFGGGYGNDTDDKGHSRGNIFNLYQSNYDAQEDYQSYGYMAGTSMACPHVSGVAALLVSYFGGPDFTNTELERLLLEGANKSHLSSTHPIGPALDAAGSFALGVPPSTIAPERVADFSMTAARRNLNISWTVPADGDDTRALGIWLLIGTNENAVRGSTPKKTETGVTVHGFRTGTALAGSTVTSLLENLSYSTTYYVGIYAYDRSGNLSPMSDIKSITMPDNHAPVIRQQPDGIILYGKGSGTNIRFPGIFQDPDGDALTYTASSSNSNIASLSIQGTSIRVRATGGGLANISILANDGNKTTACIVPVLVKEDPANPAETAPSPVTDQMTISTEEEAETYVRIVNSTGKVVYETTRVFSGFNPLKINMAGLAPGRYTVTIRYSGKTFTKTIAKV